MPEYPDAIPPVVLAIEPHHLFTAQMIGAAILGLALITIADALWPQKRK